MVTNASNQTQYFGFPLFASTDKPSWVTDWNGTVEELDSLLETLRVGISTNESAISNLERRVTDIGSEIAEMANTLAVHETAITDNKSQIDILRETLVEVSATVKSLVNANLETRMATVESSVSHVEDELGRVSDDLAELSHTVTTQGTDIDTLQDGLGTLTGRVGTISDDLDAAENDIDALESRADREDVADTRILDTLASNVVEQGVTHAREWTEGTSYVKGDFVQVPKQGVFVCTAGHTASASNKPSINETIHSVVNSQYWTSFAMWLRRMFSKIISEYQTTTEYKKDEYVTYNNNVYKAKSTNTGNLPTDADYWEAVPNLSDGGFCNAIFRKVLALASDVESLSTLPTQVAELANKANSLPSYVYGVAEEHEINQSSLSFYTQGSGIVKSILMKALRIVGGVLNTWHDWDKVIGFEYQCNITVSYQTENGNETIVHGITKRKPRPKGVGTIYSSAFEYDFSDMPVEILIPDTATTNNLTVTFTPAFVRVYMADENGVVSYYDVQPYETGIHSLYCRYTQLNGSRNPW